MQIPDNPHPQRSGLLVPALSSAVALTEIRSPRALSGREPVGLTNSSSERTPGSLSSPTQIEKLLQPN